MKFLVALARALVGCPPPRQAAQEAAPDVDEMPAFIPRENPLESAEGEEARRNAALRMVDEDCYGFLLLTVHRDAGPSVRGHIELAANLLPEWWPAVTKTLRRIIAAQRTSVAP
jgi:hypothetical protein